MECGSYRAIKLLEHAMKVIEGVFERRISEKVKIDAMQFGFMLEKGKWPCGMCKKGVGNNSILCHGCKKWVHKRCSGVKGSLLKASQSFFCRCCKVDRPITEGLNTDLHLDIGNRISLEKVDKFCYLGDMLDADGGCDSAVTARVRSA